MSERDWTLFVKDMLEAINRIQVYTDRMSLEQFRADSKTADAVIRNFGIIGEAASKVPKEIVETNKQLPWKEMRGLRNFVVHAYFDVDLRIIFETIENDIEPLKEPLRTLLPTH